MTSKLTTAVKQHETLFASIDEINDSNVTTISYTWYKNGVALPGVVADSYLLTQADVGSQIKVKTTVSAITTPAVAEIPAVGTPGSIGYAPAVPAVPAVITTTNTVLSPVKVVNVNDAPEGDLTITGITDVIRPGAVLTATNTLTDLDGLGSIQYQWLRNGKVIAGATTDKYTLITADNNKNISVKASYVDGFGTKESVTSVSDLISLNSKTTGALTISGLLVVDNTLTLTDKIKDADGLGTFSYQWLRDGVTITDAVNSTYKLTSADVNKSISAVASFVDGKGATETVTAVSTTKVYSVGNDTITSTVALDKLTGGKGADKFVFASTANSGILLSNRDTVTDFSSSQKDKLDVSGIDANTTNDAVTPVNDAFDFIGSLAFDAPGQLRFDSAARILYGNTDADIDPEFSVLLTGVNSLTAADIIA